MKILDEIQQTLIEFKKEFTEFKNVEFEQVKNDLKEVKKVLAGDEFGNQGLVKDHNDLTIKMYKIRDQVREVKIIGGVLYTLIGLILAGIALFKH